MYFTRQAVRRSVARGMRPLSGVPDYITHAAPTDVSKTNNGIRVASEVCGPLHTSAVILAVHT